MSTPANMRELLARQLRLEKELWRRECRANLRSWCIEALPRGQTPARHHDVLIRALQNVAHGVTPRLMVYEPPRHAKSEYVSKLFVPWYLAQDPRRSVIAASHTFDLAVKFGRRVRNLVLEKADILGYGLEQDVQAAGRWQTDKGGEYLAAGVGKAIAGNPADLIVIDDPVATREDAESPRIRTKTWDWYTGDLYTRRQPGARIVLVMTRWHEEDLGGILLEQQAVGGDKWEVIKLPALANAADDPLGRAADEALWPEWMSQEELKRIRKTIGERDWWSLYQQEPRPPGGAFFQVESVLVDGQPVVPPHKPDFVFAVIDSAIKTGAKHDGTGVTYYACTRGRGIPLVVLDWDIVQIEGGSLEFWLPQVQARLEELARTTDARYGSRGIWIEDKASGSVLIQQARRHPDWLVYEIDSGLSAMGKDERAINASPYVSRGDVKMAQHAYDKTKTYKQRHGNHFLMQVFRYQLGVADQADDLLDTFCYGIAIALGNNAGF